MPDQSGGWFSAALKRRPVLGLIAILIVLVIAYVVTATKDTGGGTKTPGSPSVSTAAIAGSSTVPGTTAVKPATHPVAFAVVDDILAEAVRAGLAVRVILR